MDTRDPILDEAILGWIRNTARRNFWRVAHWYELADLVQDGLYCYAKCRHKYAERVFQDLQNPTHDERRHFMTLVKTTFSRHIIDLANARTEIPPEVVFAEFTDAFLSEQGAVAFGELNVDALKKLLPPQLCELAEKLLSVRSNLRRTKIRRVRLASGNIRIKRGRWSRHETTNEYFCRLLGLDPYRTDLAGMVEQELHN